MYRTAVTVCRSMIVFALLLSVIAGVSRAGAEAPISAGPGENTLSFKFDVCPEWGECQPYANTDARLMTMATGIEAYVINDAAGWASFSGLPDGEYAFSTPAVAQKSITVTCVDANGAAVASWMGGNGPTVALAGGQSVSCTGVMVPYGQADDTSGEAQAAVNSLTFRTMICPEWSDICTPYSPAEARFVSGQTLEEQIVEVDGEGWASFPGLIDGDYGFSTPMAQPKAISVSCLDAAGNAVPTFEGGLGQTISLVGGVDATCTFIAVPNGQGPAPSEQPSDAALISSAGITVYECPAGYTGSDFSGECGTPADMSIYAGRIAFGGIPQGQTSIDAVFDENGAAIFEGLEADHYSVIVASEEAEIGAVTCQLFEGLSRDDTMTWMVDPPLGARGYEFDLPADGSANCYFFMIPFVADGDETPAASDAPAASSKPSSKPSAGASASAGNSAAVSLPNTGSGAAADGQLDLTAWILAVLAGAVVTAGAAVRRAVTR